MPETSLTAAPAVSNFSPRGGANLAIAPRDDLVIVGLAAFRGKSDVLRAIITARYGISLPEKPAAVAGKELTILWAGPAQWLAIAPRSDGRDLERELKDVAGDMAAVVDHSDGRAVLTISGSDARKVLAKGFQIDLHPSVFKRNDVAITQASHIGATLWMSGDTPDYTILVPRSFTESFCEWLLASAAEFLTD